MTEGSELNWDGCQEHDRPRWELRRCGTYSDL
jgi:hypothetical protein